MSDLIKATGLWLKTSGKSGKEYLVGRWGGVRVLIFENNERKGDNDPTHLLLLGGAEDKNQSGQRLQPTRGQSTWDRSRADDLPTGSTREYRNERRDPRQERVDELATRFKPDDEVPW